MSKAKNSIEYIKDKNDHEYITQYGIKKNFGIKDKEKISKLMHQIAELYKDNDYPASVNMIDEKKKKPLPYSPSIRVGKTNQNVMGLLYDVWEEYYMANLDEENKNMYFGKDTNVTANEIEDKLNDLMDKGYKVGTNRDVLSVLLPEMKSDKHRIESLEKKLKMLEDSIVIRKNVDYENNGNTQNYFYTDKEFDELKANNKQYRIDNPYVTDDDGSLFKEFKSWMASNPNNKPVLPDTPANKQKNDVGKPVD